jgi:hypothetical protein
MDGSVFKRIADQAKGEKNTLSASGLSFQCLQLFFVSYGDNFGVSNNCDHFMIATMSWDGGRLVDTWGCPPHSNQVFAKHGVRGDLIGERPGP